MKLSVTDICMISDIIADSMDGKSNHRWNEVDRKLLLRRLLKETDKIKIAIKKYGVC